MLKLKTESFHNEPIDQFTSLNTDTPYLFSSNRLGFRNWRENDLPELVTLNQDVDVYETLS